MVALGFVGCGGIADSHLDGLVALDAAGNNPFELVAVCDPDEERAERLAERAAAELGRRPLTCPDYETLLAEVEAVSVLVPHDLHHVVAADAFDAGVAVQLQKPIAISPRYARRIRRQAEAADVPLTVSEPSVLGADHVALARAIEDGLIGDPYLVIDVATRTTGGGFFAGTPWRHLRGRAGAGHALDHGVHRASQWISAIGPVADVFGRTAQFEPIRRDGDREIRATVEDAALTTIRFDSGALGNWMTTTAAHGEQFGGVRYYGSDGVLRPREYVASDDSDPMPWEEVVDTFAPDLPDDPFAHSYLELAAAIDGQTDLIATPELATQALGAIYAGLESATVGQPVAVDDVLSGEADEYERTVVDAMDPALR